ncbi:autotransporter family protein [Brucella sp. LJL56]
MIARLSQRLCSTVSYFAITLAGAATITFADPVQADDYHFIGTSVVKDSWSKPTSWAEGVAPDGGDRAIISGSATGIVPNGPATIGSIWITETSALKSFNQLAGASPITINGLDGAGVQSDSAQMINFFSRTILGGDIAISATNKAGGGFNFNGTIASYGSGFDTNGYTLTFDPVNAANVMNVSGSYAIRGSGNLVKTGAGLLKIDGYIDNQNYPTSPASYTGSTWIQQGTLALTGTASLRNSSAVRVDGIFDISATADGQYDTFEKAGGTSVAVLAGNGTIVLGSRNLTLNEGGSNFAGQISGSGKLIVQQGTTVLSGESTYSGGTDIDDARLNVANAKALGSGAVNMQGDAALGFLVNGLVLDNDILLANGSMSAIDTDAFSETLAGNISGSGTLAKQGNGTLIVTGTNSYTGSTNVLAGTLRAGGENTFSAASVVDLAKATALDLGGYDQTIAGLSNEGIVKFGAKPGTTLTIAGNYAGNGGLLVFNADLGGDDSATDRLAVAGNTSGSSTVQINNLKGEGAPTVEGIKIIEVGGMSDGEFALKGDYEIQGEQAVVAGAYAYQLYKNGKADPTDGDWYLRSTLKPKEVDPVTPTIPLKPLYQAGAPLYEAYPQVLQALNGMSTLQQRVGDRYWAADENNRTNNTARSSVWGRIEDAHTSIVPNSTTTLTSYDVDTYKMQAGLDGQFFDGDSGRLIGGLTAQYGKASADVWSIFGNGTIDTDGYGLGGTLTWYGDNGIYVDGQVQANWFDSDLSSVTAERGMTNGNKGFGYALGMEAGKRFAVAPRWTLTPQAQLIYSSVDFDSFNDGFGARVSLKDGDSLNGRLGLSADYRESWQAANGLISSAKVYGIANLYYEFLGGAQVNLARTSLGTENDSFWGGVGLGGTYSWSGGKYVLYGEGLLKTSLAHPNDSFGVNGTVGVKVSF